METNSTNQNLNVFTDVLLTLLLSAFILLGIMNLGQTYIQNRSKTQIEKVQMQINKLDELQKAALKL